jgi:heptosyltransferase-2
MSRTRLVGRGERAGKRLAARLARAIVGTQRVTPVEIARVRSILIVRQHNQLGDMLCAVPLLRALRSRCPEAHIFLMTSPVNHEIMLHHRLLDGVVNFDKREYLSGRRFKVGALRDFIRDLREHAFDLAIVPATVSVSFTSDLLSYLSGARWRIGPGNLEGKKNLGAFLYTNPVNLDWSESPDRHQTLRNIDICSDLGLETPDLGLELTLLPREAEEGRSEVAALRMGAPWVVAVHPGAGKIPNRWPSDSFAQLIRWLHLSMQCRVVIIKGPMDDEPIKELAKGLDVPTYLLENRGIRNIASILASVDILVSNDTGIMHVGAAVGIPVLSLFGPTNPRQWAPLGPKNRYLRCSSGVTADIKVEDVIRAVRAMLPEH